jgi:hypothetical protein
VNTDYTKHLVRLSGALLAILAMPTTSCTKSEGDATAAPAMSVPVPRSTLPGPASASAGPPSASAPLRQYTDPAADRIGVLAPGTGIPVGQKVPDIHARDLDGKDVSLSSLYTKGSILLAFYRGGWSTRRITRSPRLIPNTSSAE